MDTTRPASHRCNHESGARCQIIDRCQNHLLGGSKVRRHYLHHDYAKEKTEAWRLLGERLESILAGSPKAAVQPQ